MEQPKLVSLDADAIVDRAAARAGVSAPVLLPDVRDNLGVLLADLHREAHLNAFGRYLAGEELVRCTANALLLEEPPADEVLNVRAPIVIGGLPRTGTTLLQHLLLCDPENAGFTCADAFFPLAPIADTRTGAATRLDTLNRMAPSFAAIHPLEIDGPEECNALAQHTLASIQFSILFRLPNYLSRSLDGGIKSGYRFLPQLYWAVLAAVSDRRWVLKSPTHLLAYQSIRRMFPGAPIVQIHRDPGIALSSWCSLVGATRSVGTRGGGDEMNRAREWVEFWSGAIEGALDELPDGVCTVEYETLVEEPLVAVGAIYEWFGLELRAPAHDAMTEWLRTNAAARAAHEYDPLLVERTIAPSRLAQLRADYRALCPTT